VVPDDAQAVTTPGTTPYSAALQILLATIVSPDRLPGVIVEMTEFLWKFHLRSHLQNGQQKN